MNSFQEMNAFFGVPATSRTLEIQRFDEQNFLLDLFFYNYMYNKYNME